MADLAVRLYRRGLGRAAIGAGPSGTLTASLTAGVRVSDAAVAAVGGAAGLVQAADMAYVGYFTVPDGSAPGFGYGGMGIAMGPDGASLYYGGLVSQQVLGRISIPAISGTASVITQPTSVPGVTGGLNTTELAGALVWNNRLIVTKRNWYDTAPDYSPFTAGTTSIGGFSAMQSATGMPTTQFVAGYMGIIPPEWRTAFGASCYVGNSCLSIISQCCNGPGMFTFDPDTVDGSGAVAVTPCFYYPYGNAMLGLGSDGNRPPANDWYAWVDFTGQMLFPDGTRSVLYVYRHGYGPPTYKVEDGCYGLGGEGAAPYRRQVMAFDVDDILAAKNGSINKWAVEPYDWWVLPGPTDSCGQIGGYQNGGYCFTWDPATRRMYGALDYGETKRVHVWTIGAV